MGVFTFVCRSCSKNWTAKQVSGDLEESAPTNYELQRKLVQSAVATDSSGAVQSYFSLITPTSAVFQVIIGGATFVGGGVAAAAPAAGGAAAQAAPAEEKKEEVQEESDDGDLGFSLFD